MGTIDKTSATLEADYERMESSNSLARIALAKINLTRAYLASDYYKRVAISGR